MPEIAERIERPAHEVVYWVMGMRRYGHLVEVGDADDDGYYHYAASEGRPTMTTVDIDLFADLQRFGAADVAACFSCGTCTATCPLTDNDGTFPRRMIRYAQVGLKDELLSSKELWTCYHCGLCSDSCPTEADPAEFMVSRPQVRRGELRPDRAGPHPLHPADRRLAARGRWSRRSSPYSCTRRTGRRRARRLDLFTFIPEGLIHWTGVTVMVLLGAGRPGRRRPDGPAGPHATRASRCAACSAAGAALRRTLAAAWDTVAVESIGQRRYREDCKDDAPAEPFYRRRWFLHAHDGLGLPRPARRHRCSTTGSP